MRYGVEREIPLGDSHKDSYIECAKQPSLFTEDSGGCSFFKRLSFHSGLRYCYICCNLV